MKDDRPKHPSGSGNARNLPVAGQRSRAMERAAALRAQYLAPPPPDRPGADDDEIDLLAYWHMLVRRRWLILGIVAAVLAIALVRTLLTPPTYRATAVLEITNEGMQVMQVQGITPLRGGYDPDFNQTQYELLKSHDLAQRVAENLGLADSDIFKRLQPPSWFQRLRALWAPESKAVSAAMGNDADEDPASSDSSAAGAPITVTASGPDSAQARLQRATGLIQGGLVIDPIRNSHLVRIHYDSMLPRFAAEVANAVADGFIASSMDRRVGASSYASKYLKDQLAQLRSRLEDSEKDLVSFAKKEKIVTSDKGASLAAQNLSDLNRSLADAQAKRIQAEARWNEAKSASGAALPADMLNDSILRELQKRLAQLQGQYQDQLKIFKPEYPSMLALKSQIDAVNKQIANELHNIRASVKAEYDAAASQEKMLENQLNELRSKALEVDSRSIRYNILKRDVDTNRQLYNALLQRYKEVSMAGGVKPSNISIIDRATVPHGRYAPSLSRNLLMGLLLGAFLGVGTALVLEYLDDTLKTPEDIEHHLHLGVLGIIPKLVKQQPYQALRDPRSAFSESYRSVRTALQFATERGAPKTLLVTSPGPTEGKSTSALTLAQNFAKLGKRVLLIEADLRNPSLGRTLGLNASTGLSSLLAGAASMAQCTLASGEDKLDIILSGPLPPSPTELLAGVKLVSLMTIAEQKYDQVIIDGPPVLGIADAPILSNVARGTLLVVQSAESKIGAAQAAVKRLRGAHASLIGALLTHYDARASGYGYRYEGYYGYGTAPQLEGY